MDGRTEMDPDGTRPEPPEADSPPHIPGQVSLSSSPPQPGLAAAVPVGGPNDTNAHQLDSATIQADTPGEDPTPTADSQPSVRPSNYKTRLCMKWQQQGECSFGARCNFAHGVDEMRQHQQHQHEIVAAPVFLNTQAQPRAVNENRKTRLCTKFHQFGTCPYAEKCNFAHGVHELKQPPPGLGDMNGHANGIGNGGGIGGGGGFNGQLHPASARSNYKTRICLNWQKGGECVYAARCNFAHGAHELRGLSSQTKHDNRQQKQPSSANPNNPNHPHFPPAAIPNYPVMIAQMPFALHPHHARDMSHFQGPVVPIGAGGIPFGMAPTMNAMEHLRQAGYMPQMPMFSQQVGPVMGNMMPHYPTPSPGPGMGPPMGMPMNDDGQVHDHMN
eukprot:CAMPEP_0181300218 /NCGR_PEP_ID=MMETSP1101-20121128/6771_1 /TAXON_ID=46948 /ORGANISM="Rhodomonas abbreviata, Strain Caron Lab Isolate" /LENGTH=386 /DNA_ID=CAMNT_0023405437 /DNA_START=591 /DNA_END=1751 /DNA_ORIENTATION=+